MIILKQAKTWIVGPLVRSVRNFFFEHPMAIYICASVVLLGAELNAAIYHQVTDGNPKWT